MRASFLVVICVLMSVITLVVGDAPLPINVWRTARDTGDRLHPQAQLKWTVDNGSLPVDHSLVQVLSMDRFQTILGFGGAFTQATAIAIQKMTPALQEEIMNAYFGPNGLGYTIGRIHMGSCDFSVGNYSYNDVADDFEMKHWQLAQPDIKDVIPLIKRAQGLSQSANRSINFFGTPWSPPAWLKTNGAMDGTTFPVGMKDGANYQQAWALYIDKFVSMYNQLDIPLWGLTIQNEVKHHAKWEACAMDPKFQRDFIRNHLGPLMKKNHPDVKLMIYDDQKDASVVEWVKTIMLDPIASHYVHGTGLHWYAGDGFNYIDHARQLAPTKFFLATEACEGYLPFAPGPWLGDWTRGEHYGHDIIGDLNHYFIGWTDWNMVLDQQGGINHVQNYCDAPIIADNVKQVLHYQIPYYYMGHFSKFIRPGAVRLGTFVEDELEATSFIQANASAPLGESIVVVIMNATGQTKKVKISDVKRNLASYITIPYHSIVTLTYDL